MSFPYPCSSVLKSRALFADVLMKPPNADGAAIRLFSPKHANSRRQFLDWVPMRLPALTILEARGAGRQVGARGWRVEGSSPTAASPHEKIIVSSLPRAMGVFP